MAHDKRAGAYHQKPKKDFKPVHKEEDDVEADPDWIEFDPEKERSRFFGHVMEDEAALREKVIVKKEKKQAKD